jgi:hypothetical protein
MSVNDKEGKGEGDEGGRRGNAKDVEVARR